MNRPSGEQSARTAPTRVGGQGLRAILPTLFLILFCTAVPSARAQSQGRPPTFRHHVIFLVDASGSVAQRPGSVDEYRSAIRTRLPALLDDGASNGFGVSIYDPQQDLSSAFAFGLSRERPSFSPSAADGFMRRLWFQERGKSYADLSSAAPLLNLHWTAINSAFIQGVRKARWEAEQWAALGRAFERTFIVIISDGRSNTTTDSLDEMSNIRGAARGEGVWSSDLDADYAEAGAYTARLTNLFTLRATDSNDPGQSGGAFTVGNYKVFIRELRPQRLVNVGDLLEEAPDRETQLGRRARGMYAGTLSLAPHDPRPDEEVTYELVGLKYRLPGQGEFQEAASLPSAGHPLTQAVEVSGDEIDRATAAYQLSFVRRDPVYGQAVQVFEQTVRFRREPREYVLGLLPVTDLAMTLHPGLSQKQIAWVDSIIIFAAFGLLLYVILSPAPRAGMELSGSAAGAAAPILVAFSREGQQSEQQQVLRMLRFKNNAFRKLPFVGKMLPRLGERRFDVRVGVRGDFPPGVHVGGTVVGLDTGMDSERVLKRQTEGSQISVLLSPEAVADYDGSPGETVKCDLVVHATQKGRRFGVWPQTRRLEPQTDSFYLRFEPEEPDMRAALVTRLKSQPTGEAAARPFPAPAEGVAGWLIRPHYLGWKDEPGALPEFELQLSNAARHACSKSGRVSLKVTVARADGRGQVVEVPLGEPYAGVLTVEPHKAEPLRVPLWLPYDKLPLPAGVGGEDYVLSATLTAADGQQWAPQTVRHGVRVGPDPRRTALSFRVTVRGKEGEGEAHVHRFGSPADGSKLKVAAGVPVRWNVGRQKESSVFAVVEFDNVARNGDGRLSVRLRPGAAVRPHPDSDAAFEPTYAEPRDRLVTLRGGKEFPVGKEAEWHIENESADRPVRLAVQFQPYAIQAMRRIPPHYAYVCDLPFECVLRETADGLEHQFAFSLQLEFRVQRYAGDYALAIDFGTSAVVTAFEESERNIKTRPGDTSNATQHLQERYQELIKVWSASPEEELRYAQEYESLDHNLEHATEFIPSPLILCDYKQAGEADFVLLPATIRHIGRFWNRAVYYLKGLILRGDEHLQLPESVTGLQPTHWKDQTGRNLTTEKSPIPVDEVIRSAYRNLLANYVRPLLERQKKEEYLDRLVVAHPNNFTLGHIHRVRRILAETFPEFSRIDLLSESNAVAIYCARNATRFFKSVPEAGDSRHLLVYDIGAGTVDLTYTRLEWDSVDGASQLKEMKVLFKAGLPVAGNRLDACLAMVLDKKIRDLQAQLAGKGVTLNYNEIADPTSYDPAQYPQRMLALKRSLHELKLALSGAGDEEQTFHVPVNTSGDTTFNVITIPRAGAFSVQAALAEAGITEGKDSIGIPLTSDDIYSHPEVIGWLDQVADGLIRNFAGALKVLGVKPQIDTLILSGRTSEFVPLRRRLFEAIRAQLGLDGSGYVAPPLERNEKKEAVALGSLLYAIFHGHSLRLTDRNVWAKYGIVYNEGGRQKFKEFFGYASERRPEDEEVEDGGMKTTFFRRTHELTRSDGPLEIAATFSHDPDADLRDGNGYYDRFQVIHSIGAGQLGPAGRLKVHMRNNRDDTITVVVNPDRIGETGVTVRGVREDAHIVQMEWPYRPLERKPNSKGASSKSPA